MATSVEPYESDGPVLLLAGPGTGKTYQLGRRIKFLVDDQKVAPSDITVITFTAAAAANMRERISDPGQPELSVPKESQPASICTMHSLGYRIIRENAQTLGLPERVSVVHEGRAKRVLVADAAQLAGHRRADAKETLMCRQYGDCKADQSRKCQVCECYCAILKSCGAIDYDDQILVACKLLQENSDIAATYRQQTRHLLVDEYQDINAGQFELIRTLCKGQENGLFVVGDDDQSIYSWRGGSPEFIRQFEAHFGPAATVILLTTSRRCHRRIMETALDVVRAFDTDRRDKGTLTYVPADGPHILIHNVPSDKGEAQLVRQLIMDAIPSKRVLVLVPTRKHAKLICEQLRRAGVTHTAPEPLPGEGLPLISKLAAWFRNEGDSLACRECMEAILSARSAPLPSERSRKPEKLNQREDTYLRVSELWHAVIDERKTLWMALQEGAKQVDILAFIKERCQALKDCEQGKDVPRFLAEIARAIEPWRSTSAVLEETETWVDRYGARSHTESNADVRVMTFQGAKGLEADVVCIVGLEDGTVPRASGDNDALPEQARLLYVSMTRSKSELHLVHARVRSGAVSFQNIHGPKGPHKLDPSPFLMVMSAEHLKRKYRRGSK